MRGSPEVQNGGRLFHNDQKEKKNFSELLRSATAHACLRICKCVPRPKHYRRIGRADWVACGEHICYESWVWLKECPRRRPASSKKSSFLQETSVSALCLCHLAAQRMTAISAGRFMWVRQELPGLGSLGAVLLPVQLPPGVLQQSGLRCASGPETRSAECPDHIGY